MKDSVEQQYQAEGIERGADAGGCGDQPQGNEPGGHRADEDRCPAGRFGDRRGPCSLQGEMLGGHERDCVRPRSRAACPGSRVLVTTRSLTIFQATARQQLSQQSRTGEPDEPGGHGQAHLEALALEDVRTGQREQVASVAWSRTGQIPASKSTRVCRWPLAWLVMKSGSCNDLGGENHGDEPVHGGAKRRPPPCVGHVVAPLLPEVLETVAGVAKDKEPGRSGDPCGGKQDERASDSALDGDHLGSSVCHCESDVDRCDQG